MLRRHPIFTLLSVASLLLLAGMLALWASSWSGRTFGWIWIRPAPGFQNAHAHLVAVKGDALHVASFDCDDETAGSLSYGRHRNPGFQPVSPGQGLHLFAGGWELRLHPMIVVALAAVLPAWWVRQLRRVRRFKRARRLGLCPACLYDMRETPERCPECGYAGGVQRRLN
jgi:hypothetical protein